MLENVVKRSEFGNSAIQKLFIIIITVNKTDSDSGFRRFEKFAFFPQNVLLRVAYT